ncbi:MAG: hypothetical protein ABI569_05005 [Casimicrobiaceae bacterium]
MAVGKLILFAFAIAEAASGAAPSSLAAMQAVADATGAGLQADAARAIRRLRDVPLIQFQGDDRKFRACMEHRFGGPRWRPSLAAISEPFSRRALAAYQAYWHAALLQPAVRKKAEATLLATLRRLLARNDLADMDALEPVLQVRLRESGYYSLQGMTGPLRELMLWSAQDTREIRVVLPEGTHTTKVMLLDDFSSLGWSAFATCDRRSTGGWATTEALFAVRPRYKNIEDEEFRVSLLGHETQHFSDYERFPGLAQWELEYRAKLTELAQADETRARVLRKFDEDQGDDPSSPHAYANKRVLAALRRRLALPEGASLDAVGVATLQAAAAGELREDSRRRVLPARPAM